MATTEHPYQPSSTESLRTAASGSTTRDIEIGRVQQRLVRGEVSALIHTDLLTPQELAERLKVPKSWVYEKTRGRSRDPLPVMRIGKYMRFHWPDIVLWLKVHQEGAA